jgi:hypothetical protein
VAARRHAAVLNEVKDHLPHLFAKNLLLRYAIHNTPHVSSKCEHIFETFPFLYRLSSFFGSQRLLKTKAGIAEIFPGDVIEATIEKIGTLRNYVVGY